MSIIPSLNYQFWIIKILHKMFHKYGYSSEKIQKIAMK